jgi:hypothetical protein
MELCGFFKNWDFQSKLEASKWTPYGAVSYGWLIVCYISERSEQLLTLLKKVAGDCCCLVETSGNCS